MNLGHQLMGKREQGLWRWGILNFTVLHQLSCGHFCLSSCWCPFLQTGILKMASFSLNCSLNLLLSSESLVSYVKGSQAGAPVGTWKQAPKLRTACLAPFHTQLMPTCPGTVSHSGYGPPTSIISQEKYPTATPHSHAPQPQSDESDSSTELSSSQVTPVVSSRQNLSPQHTLTIDIALRNT